jgi:hypothetical protein
MSKQRMEYTNPGILESRYRLPIDELFTGRPTHKHIATVVYYAHSLEVENEKLKERLTWAEAGRSARLWRDFGRDIIVLIVGALLGLSPTISQLSTWALPLSVAFVILLSVLWLVLWRASG